MRARLKAFQEIDPALFCCEKVASTTKEQWAIGNGISFAIEDSGTDCSFLCEHCGSKTEFFSMARVLEGPFAGRVIFYANLDIEEGVA